LYIGDACGVPLNNTKFSINLKLFKSGPQITIQFPVISFQTGQFANIPGENLVPPLQGGYVYTSSGFLPKEFRPTDLIYRSVLVADDKGLTLPYSYNQNYSTLPVPLPGYILGISDAGAITIMGAGTFGTIIPTGSHTVRPADMVYLVEPKIKIKKNFRVTNKALNIIKTIQPPHIQTGTPLRDSHINSSFDNVNIFAMVDNSKYTKPTMTIGSDVTVKRGVYHKKKIHFGPTVFLTDLPENVVIFDTAATIDPTNPNNVCVSYGVTDFNLGIGACARAISNDNGKTWPNRWIYTSFQASISGTTLTVTAIYSGTLQLNNIIAAYDVNLPGTLPYTKIIAFGTGTGGIGTYTIDLSQNVVSSVMLASPQDNGIVPINAAGSTGFGDCEGAQYDETGNLWYGCTNAYDGPTQQFTGQPVFSVSYDKGLTFQIVLELPTATILANQGEYDFPQYSFGGKLSDGSYRLWYNVDYSVSSVDINPVIGFIPILGFSNIGTPSSSISLTDFNNNIVLSSITASEDNKVWVFGTSQGLGPGSSPSLGTNIAPQRFLFKSPGDVDKNYAGPFNFGYTNSIGSNFLSDLYVDQSLPYNQAYGVARHYFTSVITILCDNKKKLLYQLLYLRSPDFSQNMRIVLGISTNNGLSTDIFIDCSNTNKENRGFPNMNLDPVTGNLTISWYDNRKGGPNGDLFYYTAILTSKKIKKLVKNHKTSDPIYSLPSSGTPIPLDV
jgi:hypothetical protein